MQVMAFDASIPDASLHKYVRIGELCLHSLILFILVFGRYLIGTTSYPSNFSTDGDLLGAIKLPVSITQSEIASGLAQSRSKKLRQYTHERVKLLNFFLICRVMLRGARMSSTSVNITSRSALLVIPFAHACGPRLTMAVPTLQVI